MNRLDLEDRLVDFADRYPRLGLFVGLSYFATGLFYNVCRDYVVYKFRREEKKGEEEHEEFPRGPPYEDL